MATPTYITAWRGRDGNRHLESHLGAVGTNRWFGSRTPRYAGSGQPEVERGGSWLGGGTPAYLSAPSSACATATAPQADALAIVVPRS